MSLGHVTIPSLARVEHLFTEMPAGVFWEFAIGFLELRKCLQNR